MTCAKENYFLVCGDNSDDPDELRINTTFKKILLCVYRHVHDGMIIRMLVGMAR